MVAINAPSPGNVTPGQLEPELSEFGFDDPAELTQGERRGKAHRWRNPDPSPDEIAEQCRQIRSCWTDEEYRARAAGLAWGVNDNRARRDVMPSGWTVPVCPCDLAAKMR